MRLKEQIRQWEDEERSAAVTGWDFPIYGTVIVRRTAFHGSMRRSSDGISLPRRVFWIWIRAAESFFFPWSIPIIKRAATEAWEPNIRLCRERLLPLGIDFRETDGTGLLPFPDETFELVINRHGDYQPEEVFRILSPGGTFVTQQVGGENDRELRELLLPEVSPPYPEWNAGHAAQKLAEAGFSILQKEEAYTPIRFLIPPRSSGLQKLSSGSFPVFR